MMIALGAAGAVIVAVVWGLIAHRRARVAEANLADAKARLRDLELTFRRFAPSEVVHVVADSREAPETSRREVTVLFADLQGFTSLAEELAPEELVDLLNGYFHAMDEAIAAHHGQISKFLGDGVLALFGAIRANPWQARDAVDAALAMRAALNRYNEGAPRKLSMGIGIHSGEVVAGVMGSERLREFTVIGDPVNTAARVESLTRHHKVDVLVTDAIRERLGDDFELGEMPAVSVKGKGEAVRTWAVVGRRGQASRPA